MNNMVERVVMACKIQGTCEHGIDFCYNCKYNEDIAKPTRQDEPLAERYHVHKIRKRYGVRYAVFDARQEKYLILCKDIGNAQTIAEILKTDSNNKNYIESVLCI